MHTGAGKIWLGRCSSYRRTGVSESCLVTTNADDAQVCLLAYAGVTTAAAKNGLGRHIEAVVIENPQNLITVGLLAQLCQVFAVMACTLGKSAFAITLLRIMTQRWIIYTIWFILITMNLVNVLTCFFVFLQCKIPEHIWNPSVPSKCWDPSIFTNFSLFVGCKSI